MSAAGPPASLPAVVADAAPAVARTRGWGPLGVAAPWIAAANSTAGAVFAERLFAPDLPGWQTLLAVAVGAACACGLANLMGAPSQTFGEPFGVMARAAFGVRGAWPAALVRALVAVVGHGAQLAAAAAIARAAAASLWPAWAGPGLDWAGFAVVAAAPLAAILAGERALRGVLAAAAFSGAAGLAALAIATHRGAGAPGVLPLFEGAPAIGLDALTAMATTAALVAAGFAPMVLSAGDYARFAESEAAVRRGGRFGLPVYAVVFAALAAVLADGVARVWGLSLADPAPLVLRIADPAVRAAAAAALIVVTLASGFAAHVVSGAYALASLSPGRLGYRQSGAIVLAAAAFTALAVDRDGAIVAIDWAGAALGAIVGVTAADFYIVKRRALVRSDLFSTRPDGAYFYAEGVNHRARTAALAGTLAGLVTAYVAADLAPFAAVAWLAGLAAGAAAHLALPAQARTEAAPPSRA